MVGLRDKYAAKIFEEFYHENGLVLNTVETMRLTSQFISSAAAVTIRLRTSPFSPKNYEIPEFPNILKKKSKGKSSKDDVNLETQCNNASKLLANHLIRNRNFQTALSTTQRTSEIKYKVFDSKKTDNLETDDDFTQTVQNLIKNVMSHI
ncbi:hypothetical protein HK096_007285 [Nowakowskiella sp. JEL0078]|nr:hypothetical protein HK096_007285 [Nowakowskiella sp. JEL0078]